MKHTPLPWTSVPGHPDSMNPQAVIEAKDQFVCQTVAGNDNANAYFIVRACNSHYELLEALKECEDFISAYHDDAEDMAIYEQVTKAIKQAEGKT